MPKIKYGLKNVHYAKISSMSDADVPSYTTPVAWPGAVNLSLDPQGERVVFYADNIEYWVTTPDDGYEGDYESALVPDSFLKDILGYIEDANGVLVENADAEPAEFALLFEFANDVNATRHVLYRVSAGRPAVAGSTKEETITPQTETASFRAVSVYNESLKKHIVKAKAPYSATTTDPYATWYDAVYIPTAATSG